MSFRNTLQRASYVSLAALAATLLGGCVDDTSESKPPTETDKHLVVLFTSDEHSHMFGFSPELDDHPPATKPGTGELVGGIARRATVIGRERKAAKDAGKDSILVSAGDNQMGALPHVAFEVASIDYGTMKALGYDVTTLGNHEFDFGPGALAKSLTAGLAGEGLPPIVASNIKFSAEDGLDDDLEAHYSEDVGGSAAIHPYRVVTTEGGLKVGVFGWIGVNAEHVAPNKTPVQFSAKGLKPDQEGKTSEVYPKLYADLQKVVDTLRDSEKVDIVIGLSHGGLQDTSTEEDGEDYHVATNVKGIDLIVSGHSHIGDPKPVTVKNEMGGADTLILNGGSFGQWVGRVDFALGEGAPTWDKTTQEMLPVDDKIIPDANIVKSMDALVSVIEKSDVGPGSYLEGLLSRVDGVAVTDDPNVAGDLYFHPVGKTDFDVRDAHSLIFLSSDSMLAASDVWAVDNANTFTDVSIESAGVIRGVINKGKTGVISAADAFSVVPLGSSPVDATLGYPLARGYLSKLELRAVFEFSLSFGPSGSDFDIGMAGVQVEYDATRPPVKTATDIIIATKGQVMRILLDTDHSNGFDQFDTVIYDRTTPVGSDAELFSVVSSSYIFQFASDVGAVPKQADGSTIPNLADAILKRPDASEIKQLEAFLGYIKASPGGTLDARYNIKSPSAAKRFVCINGC